MLMDRQPNIPVGRLWLLVSSPHLQAVSHLAFCIELPGKHCLLEGHAALDW